MDLTRYERLRVICFVEKNDIDFGELARIPLSLNWFHAGIRYILKLNLSPRNTRVFPRMFYTCTDLNIMCKFDSA